MAQTGLTPEESVRLSTVERKVLDIHESQTGIIDELKEVAKAIIGLTFELKSTHTSQKTSEEKIAQKADKGHLNQVHDIARDHESRIRTLERTFDKEQGTRDTMLSVKKAVISGGVLLVIGILGTAYKLSS